MTTTLISIAVFCPSSLFTSSYLYFTQTWLFISISVYHISFVYIFVRTILSLLWNDTGGEWIFKILQLNLMVWFSHHTNLPVYPQVSFWGGRLCDGYLQTAWLCTCLNFLKFITFLVLRFPKLTVRIKVVSTSGAHHDISTQWTLAFIWCFCILAVLNNNGYINCTECHHNSAPTGLGELIHLFIQQVFIECLVYERHFPK